MAQHNETGKWGEQLAVDRLTEQGYTIVDRNWRTGSFEIDIVARRGDEVVFAEVKTRQNKEEDPLEAIDNRKIAHMCRAAELWLHRFHEPWVPSFDLFAVRGVPDDYELEHIPDAFFPPLKKY